MKMLILTILAKTSNGGALEIIVLLLVAGIIAFLTAYFYYKSVYMKRINLLEEVKSILGNKITRLERELDELNKKLESQGK